MYSYDKIPMDTNLHVPPLKDNSCLDDDDGVTMMLC